MTGSPLPLASPVSEWTLYSILQLAVPFVAIVLSSCIALWVSRRAYKDALRVQAEATRLEREQRAHDELLAVLARFIEWLAAAKEVLRVVAVEPGERQELAPDEAPEAVSQGGNALEVARVLEAAESLKDTARWIRDAAVFFPIRRDVLFYLDILGPSTYSFWAGVQRRVKDSPPPGQPPEERGAAQLKNSLRYIDMVSAFCKELRVLVLNRGLQEYRDAAVSSASLGAEKWHWMRLENELWGFDKTPPYLPGLFDEDAAAGMAREFASEPQETWHFGDRTPK